MRETNQALLAFLAGAAAGGIAGLLLAPSSGDELRRRIGEGAEKTRDDARERVRAVGEKVHESYDATAERAREMVGQAWASAEAHRMAVKQALHEGMAAYERELRKEH